MSKLTCKENQLSIVSVVLFMVDVQYYTLLAKYYTEGQILVRGPEFDTHVLRGQDIAEAKHNWSRAN